MKLSKLFAALFGIVGIASSAFGIWLSLSFKDSVPTLLEPAMEAQSRAAAMMDAVCAGDYDTAGSMILGNPRLGVDRAPADQAGAMIWEVFRESFSYELVGDCYATDSGLAQNIRLTCLELGSVTGQLRERSQTLLEQRVAQAQDVSEIYDENNEYREDFVMEVFYQALQEALAEDAESVTRELTVNLVYRGGDWWVVSDDALMEAISGGIVG